MAPRKTSKTAKNATEGMEMILSTEPLKTIGEAADYVGISGFELQEKFTEALNLPAALNWETVPTEHEHLLNEFKAQASATVQVLPEMVEAPETPVEQPTTPQISSNDETPTEVEKGGKMAPKSKTSGITNKRKKSIGKQLQNIETIDLGIDNAEALNLVRDAAADGVELGQAQVLAKESARLSVRRKAYERTTAKLKEKAVKRSDYDPTDLLKQAGLQVSDDLLEDLQEFSEVSLGKLQTVFEEVTGDVWGNGYTNDFSELDAQLDWSE